MFELEGNILKFNFPQATEIPFQGILLVPHSCSNVFSDGGLVAL